MQPKARGKRNDSAQRQARAPAVTVFSELDREAMQHALTLAARGLTTTDPNPRVGCVIAQGARIVGEGWHERAGEAHAEVAALAAAGGQAAGATVYVTLEPCSHHGRTPPCVEALLHAGVARVVFAAVDPNPQVNGRGAAALRDGGVEVEGGLLERETLELNCGFVKRMAEGRPWVRVKLAMSLDGRTALATGESRWITGEAAREDVQQWRARSSAILTGIGTVLADDPRLDVRLPAEAAEQPAQPPRQPLRVVLDSHLRTPPGARLVAGGGEVLILTAQSSLKDVQSGMRLTARGVRIESAPEANGRLLLGAVLDRLGELEVNELQVEAGPTLAGELVRHSLVDELLLYVAPRLLGDEARPLLELPAPAFLSEARAFTLIEMRQLGDDLRLRLRPRVAAAPAVPEA
jgi:diaminohydroxyphosphoribosylaminopyrimidine deaminase/5-amino-6-(5-phosphoribosylamino)uracil reductase